MVSYIIPTIFATSKEEFIERFSKLIKVSKNLQIDFMDGRFVRNKSIAVSDIPNLKKYDNYFFEVHLMVNNPENYVNKLNAKGFRKIIFHYEAVRNKKGIFALINKIKSLKMEAFLAINPETTIGKIKGLIGAVDGVLLMGVHPGKEHQSFISSVYNKVKQVRRLSKKIPIQIDGGINFSIAKKLAKLGVNYINSGSFVYNSDNPVRTIRELNSCFK